MSSRKEQEKINELFENFKNADHKAQVALSEEINKKILKFLAAENNDAEAKVGAFDFLSWISESVQEEFDERLSIDSNKKNL